MDQDKSFITEFHEVYRRHPALWNTKSDLSKNKHLKKLGIEDLIKLCQGKCNGADEAFVKGKINNLRTAYRRELNKVRLSKSTGSSADDIYVPSLWYFDLMAFTAEYEVGRKDPKKAHIYNVEEFVVFPSPCFQTHEESGSMECFDNEIDNDIDQPSCSAKDLPELNNEV
ncbi:uncharacterized protein LOC111028123 [Myzus persicae]|uniref:uncharacterized protein LOC111028123 n=1 Tax=Myzus persicae TaxID=13164 RepID=UPI000B938D2B|nr:uncharacterized protein LOC111028123 [Myzus persicae]